MIHRFNVTLGVSGEDAVRYAEALTNELLAAEMELIELKVRDTILVAGWHPDSADGARLVEEMYQLLELEEEELLLTGSCRPVEMVWELGTLLGMVPDWASSSLME
jgi:hypothetical protein